MKILRMETEVRVMLLLEGGHKPRNVGALYKLEKTRNKFSPRASRRKIALPTHFRLKTSRTII